VAFQLLSQNDIRNVKTKLVGDIHTKAWDVFCKHRAFDHDNDEQLGFSRHVFLFLTDIFLKTKNTSPFSVKSFEEAINLAVLLMSNYPDYLSKFSNTGQRDIVFLESLRHVERNESRYEAILNFCGTLTEKKQFRLFVNICLYADIYKRVAPISFPDKRVQLSNKHCAVNWFLKHKFSFWGSDLTIPCIISDYASSVEFTLIWTESPKVKFIDDIRNEQTSIQEENFILQIYDDLSVALLPKEKNIKVICCGDHSYRMFAKAQNCKNTDSLNMRCVNFFGKSLGEIIEYV